MFQELISKESAEAKSVFKRFYNKKREFLNEVLEMDISNSLIDRESMKKTTVELRVHP